MNQCCVVPGWSPDFPQGVCLSIDSGDGSGSVVQIPAEYAVKLGLAMTMIAEHSPALAESNVTDDASYRRAADRLSRRLVCIEDYSIAARRRFFDKRIDAYVRVASIAVAFLAAGIAVAAAVLVKGITILEILRFTYQMLSEVSVVVLGGIVTVAWLRFLADRDEARAFVLAVQPPRDPEPKIWRDDDAFE